MERGSPIRSKYMMSSNRNFSAVCRSGPLHRKPVAGTECAEVFLSSSCSNANDSLFSSTKDLRMKRIFTPEVKSVNGEETEDEKNEERRKLCRVSDSGRVIVLGIDIEKDDELEKSRLLRSEINRAVEYVQNPKNKETSGSKMVRSEINSAVENVQNPKDKETSGSKMALNRCNRKKVFRTASSFSYRRMLPYLMDVANDASCVSKIEIVDGMNSEERQTVRIESGDLKPSENQDSHLNVVDALMEEDIQTTPPEPSILTKKTMKANKLLSENHSPSAKHSTNSLNRSAYNPCSRLRLFNNSRSLGYRRMLPFLMDISKDNSCTGATTQHQILLKSAIEKDNKAANSCEDKYTHDFASSTVPHSPSNGSSVSNVSFPKKSSNLESNISTSERLPEEIANSTSSQLEPSSIVNSDVQTEQCASEEPDSLGNQKMYLDTGSEPCSSNSESTEEACLEKTPLSDVLVCPNVGAVKGILKRNPLGCRGLCNCLNCASFRLHAERAFEFSRNQMHNVEEVAFSLMEELANLRVLLEKSSTQNSCSVGIQPNPDLVNHACNKALEAEKLAKERLIELNYDLGVHCRIPDLVRPKVTFASNILERTTPAMDPSSRM